jgi:bacillithiol system protein YtxJ
MPSPGEVQFVRALSSMRDVQAVVAASHPVLLFKHSLVCPLSQSAFDWLIRHVDLGMGPTTYVITVQACREMCESISRIFAVPHETPQAILIHAGRAVWHRSHRQITGDTLVEAAVIADTAIRSGAAPSLTVASRSTDEFFNKTAIERTELIARMSGVSAKDSPSRDDHEPDDEDDEAPETPLDEPAPTPIQDPPSEPDQRPYTVRS